MKKQKYKIIIKSNFKINSEIMRKAMDSFVTEVSRLIPNSTMEIKTGIGYSLFGKLDPISYTLELRKL